jgi:hypothetical protein
MPRTFCQNDLSSLILIINIPNNAVSFKQIIPTAMPSYCDSKGETRSDHLTHSNIDYRQYLLSTGNYFMYDKISPCSQGGILIR